MFEEEQQQPQEQNTPPPEVKGDDEVKTLRDELKSLRGRVSEAENNTRYWYERANSGTAADAPKEDEDEDVQLDEDLVDVLSSGDTKRVKQTFKKLGFVSEKDVQRRIAETRAQITQESKLFGEYPDLQDQDSPLFKAAAEEYGDLAKEHGDSPKTLKLAAKIAALKIGYDKNAQRHSSEDEEDRVERVSSQQGTRSRTPSNQQKNEGFTDTQSSIIRKFQAVGSSLTPDSYRKRAETGVRMGARNAGMRRGK